MRNPNSSIELVDVIEAYTSSVYAAAATDSEKTFGEVSHSFIHGYTKSNLTHILDNLGLTKKQMKILIESTEYMNSRVGV